jgi:hypothetical protein
MFAILANLIILANMRRIGLIEFLAKLVATGRPRRALLSRATWMICLSCVAANPSMAGTGAGERAAPAPRPHSVERYEPLWEDSLFNGSVPGAEIANSRSGGNYRLLGIGGLQDSPLVYVTDLETGKTHEVSLTGTELRLVRVLPGLGANGSQVEIRDGSKSFWVCYKDADPSQQPLASSPPEEDSRQELIRRHIERQRQRQQSASRNEAS